MTIIVTHEACLSHRPPPGHPERSERLQAVLNRLKNDYFQSVKWISAPSASREALARVHSQHHVDSILVRHAAQAAASGLATIDPDTVMSPGSAEAALRAAGAVIEAVDRVMAGEAANAFCAVRPPGHHAERDRAMGFCLFNNIAVGALHARTIHGLQRIAVVDFDVHHGNGTQDIFWNDPNLFYASTHQSPLYPGTGNADETGISGNIVNVPLPQAAGLEEFRGAFEEIILPALESFSPQFVFISAGFDAHKSDPLAQLQLEESDFEWATRAICAVADRACEGRVVSSLEGGYDLDALALCAAAHVRALCAASR
ncbi:MAG TPA: histone deacetylase family protein [Rhizomicrobium sp.]|jgi:acetoin utilization deacetylase AcuC-like enzyme|nr:histone deacetylase family protein [Rhizomicrobium sp.]